MSMPGPIPSDPRQLSGGAIRANEFIDKRWELQNKALKPDYQLPVKTIKEYVDPNAKPKVEEKVMYLIS